MNVVIISGRLSRPPVEQELPSGDLLCRLEVTVRSAAEPTTSVPVAVLRPSAAVRALAGDEEVVVLGSVRRRFFRTPAGTGSRTEVLAERVVRAGRRRDLDRVRGLALEQVERLGASTVTAGVAG
jgi:single-strand DNA-binding protein